ASGWCVPGCSWRCRRSSGSSPTVKCGRPSPRRRTCARSIRRRQRRSPSAGSRSRSPGSTIHCASTRSLRPRTRPRASGSTTRTASRATATISTARGTTPPPSTRFRRTSRTTAPSPSSPRASCSGGLRRAVPDTGAGDGPAAVHMLPRPRNFTGAVYKIRTTASGQLPTDADLMRAIDEGLPGSAMPAWKGRLSDAERRDVMAYLKTFSSFFADTSQHVAALKFSSAPAGGTDPSALKEGRRFYEDSIHCNKCHGDQGRGDGPSAPTLKDDAAWARVDRYWFPLVGQVIRKLRWFAPAVSGVWVQAVHDGKAVAVRVSWDDRSQSPDTAWLGFERRVRETVAGDDSGASAETGRWPDQLAVQFPRRIPEGMER